MTIQTGRRLLRQPSERWVELVEDLADGLMGKEIAVKRWLSINTVKTHLSDMRKTYDCPTSAGLVGLFMREGWIK